MNELYAIDCTSIDEADIFKIAEVYLSPLKMRQISGLYFEKDRVRSMCASLMAIWALSTRFDVHPRKVKVEYSSAGKPFCNFPYQFSLSHSDKWVVCGLGNGEIGVDIEKIENIDLQIAAAFFAKQEIEDIFSLPLSDQKIYFYDLWTLKESYIKTIGVGLSMDLNSFSIEKDINGFKISVDYSCADVYFMQYNIDSNYKLSACSMDKDYTDQVKVILLDDLIAVLGS